MTAPSTDETRETTALNAYDNAIIKKVRDYQIRLGLADQIAREATADRDRAVREADARVEAMEAVLDALIGSLRPYGLDRKKFVASIASVAGRTPTDGPKAVQHAMLHAASARVLRRGSGV